MRLRPRPLLVLLAAPHAVADQHVAVVALVRDQRVVLKEDRLCEVGRITQPPAITYRHRGVDRPTVLGVAWELALDG